MIRYFVEPRPDEIFHSIIARYQKNTLLSYRQTLIDLFKCRHISLNFFCPNNIGAFISTVDNPISFSEIVDNHTLLPLFFHFYPQPKINEITENLRNNKQNRILYKIKEKSSIKYCPECAKEDYEKFDETYWHRIHNLPNIPICVKHNCYLEVWKPPEEETGCRKVYCADVVQVNAQPTRRNSSNLTSRVSAKLASLLDTASRINKEDLVCRGLKLNVIRKGKSNSNALKQCFFEKFQNEAIKIDENLRNYFSRMNTTQAILQNLLSGDQPMLYSLFECLISELNLPPSNQERIGQLKFSPVKCINGFCEKFKQSIHTKTDLRNFKYTLTFPSLIQCPYCGMAYSAVTRKGVGSFRRIRFGELFEKKVKALLRKGASIEEISKLSFVKRTSLNNIIEKEFHCGKIHLKKVPGSGYIKLGHRRRLWLAEINSPSFASMRKSKKKLASISIWLSKYDKDWFLSTNKLRSKNGIRKGRPKGSMSQDVAELINKDKFYYDLLTIKKEQLLRRNIKRRITKTLLLSMPEFALLREQLKVLPKCSEFFGSQCETHLDCNQRKMTHALEIGRPLSSAMKSYYRKMGLTP